MGREEVIFLHPKYLLGYGEWRIYKASWRSGFLKWRTESMSVSPTLDIHSVTVVTINYAFHFLLFTRIRKMSKPKAWFILELEECSLIRIMQKIWNKITGSIDHCQKCWWNCKQERNNQILCGLGIQNWITKFQRMILCHWIGKTKDHSWFSLAQKT